MTPDHIHRFVEKHENPFGPPARDREAPAGSYCSKELITASYDVILTCYQDDCYAEGCQIRLDRKAYPPELIGPKLYLTQTAAGGPA